MNRVAKAISSVEIVGAASIASRDGVFRSSRQAYQDGHFQNLSRDKKTNRALRQLEKMTGGPRSSYQPKLGGDKLNYAARTKAPSSAILVRPGEHVPQDFGAPEWLEYSKDLHDWQQIRESKSSLLMWFEMTTEGKASREGLDRLKAQLESSRDQIREMAVLGDLVSEEAFSAAVNAANRNADALKAAEQVHFEKGSAKHLLAKPKDPSNTKKVVSSILESMVKPGEHLAARQTPEVLRKIGVDKNGNITGKPSADRVRTSDGSISLVEPIEVTDEDVKADKKESAQHKIQKTSGGELSKIEAAEDKIEFLRSEVSRLEAEKAEHGLGKNQRQDLARLSRELKAAETRLTNRLAPVKSAVRGSGVKKLSGCEKHQGRTNCPCHRENFIVTEVDGKRGIIRRTAR